MFKKEDYAEKLYGFEVINVVEKENIYEIELAVQYGEDFTPNSKITYSTKRWFFGIPYEGKGTKFFYTQPFVLGNSKTKETRIPSSVGMNVRPKYHHSIALLSWVMNQCKARPVLTIYKELQKLSYTGDYANFLVTLKKHQKYLLGIDDSSAKDYAEEQVLSYIEQDDQYLENSFEQDGEYDNLAVVLNDYVAQIMETVEETIGLQQILHETFVQESGSEIQAHPNHLLIPYLFSLMNNLANADQPLVLTTSTKILNEIGSTFLSPSSALLNWKQDPLFLDFTQQFRLDLNGNHIYKEYDEIEDHFNLALGKMREQIVPLIELPSPRRLLLIDCDQIIFNLHLSDTHFDPAGYERANFNNHKPRAHFGYHFLLISQVLPVSALPIFYRIEGMDRYEANLVTQISNQNSPFLPNDILILHENLIDFNMVSILKKEQQIDSLILAKKRLYWGKKIYLQAQKEAENGKYIMYQGDQVRCLDSVIPLNNGAGLRVRAMIICSDHKGHFQSTVIQNIAKDHACLNVEKNIFYMVFFYTGNDLEEREIIDLFYQSKSKAACLSDIKQRIELDVPEKETLATLEVNTGVSLITQACVEAYRYHEKGKELANSSFTRLVRHRRSQSITSKSNPYLVAKDQKYKLYTAQELETLLENLDKGQKTAIQQRLRELHKAPRFE